MKTRKRLMRMLAHTQEAGAPIQILMQAMTLTLVAFGYIAWRGFNTYYGIALLFVLILGAILAWGYLYVEVLGLFRAKRASVATMDPVQVYAMTPYQEMMIRTVTLPNLRNNRAIAAHLGLDTTEIDASIANVEAWQANGFIPKDQFPPELLHHYKTEGHRL
ncbi:MAG: hypothetical protein ACPHID_08140 [Thermoplasmatota archaeon]